MKEAFQVRVERTVSEEFFPMLEEASLEGKDTPRNGYCSRKIRTAFGDFSIQIPRARFLDFATKFLKRYGHNTGDPGEKVMSLYRGGMSENDIVKALAEAEGMGVCASTIQKIVHTIEAINLKYKKETRKRILLNLEDNATIVTIIV
jgi:transposase-like protein